MASVGVKGLKLYQSRYFTKNVRVAERCLFTKQYVAYGEICHFCVL